MKVILSGGGTGGHVYPALAVGQALRHGSNGVELLYVGVRGRLDEAIVQPAGLRFEAVHAGPLRVWMLVSPAAKFGRMTAPFFSG